ncbi:MAG: transposase family protein [Gemmatimonadota bacterium]|nr:transposase family protein [Gemmatimonadota bacterium]MDE2986267.1 transposase family protein [Gemmatimonadota bacterium]
MNGPFDAGLLYEVLALSPPWYVREVGFDDESRNTVEVTLEFTVGSEFTCSACGADGCKAYDTLPKRWRHVDLFQYRCFLRAYSPRVGCPKCGIRQAEIPWARLRSRVTYEFEEYLLNLMEELPSYRALARIVGEHDTRVTRLVKALTERRP